MSYYLVIIYLMLKYKIVTIIEQSLKKFIRTSLNESAADSYIPKITVSNFEQTLSDYYHTGSLKGVALPEITDQRCKWLLQQLLGLINELRENNIDTADFVNANNWGVSKNGDLVMFDIGFSTQTINFSETPSDIELNENNETRIGIPEETIKKLFSKLGLTAISRLGNGQFGDAYDVGGGKVLKITTDKSEAVNCKNIIGGTYKHIASVYEVRQFTYVKNSERGGDIYYTILLEKVKLDSSLEPLMGQLKQYFTDARNSRINPDAIKAIRKRNPIVGEIMTDFYTEGERSGWDKWLPIRKSGGVPESIDMNDLEELTSWIKGAKNNIHHLEIPLPSFIVNYLEKYLTTSVG